MRVGGASTEMRENPAGPAEQRGYCLCSQGGPLTPPPSQGHPLAESQLSVCMVTRCPTSFPPPCEVCPSPQRLNVCVAQISYVETYPAWGWY